MTGFELYLLIYFVANTAAALCLIGFAPIEYTRGMAILSFLWGIINVWLLLTIGVG